jgi:D-alanine-D-alanine ligase
MRTIALDLVPAGAKGARFKTPDWAKRVSPGELIRTLQKSGVKKVFLCLHGPGGEDGRVQGLLDLAGIAYTGSGPLASAMAMHKRVTKEIMLANGLPTPAWISVFRGGKVPRFPLPCVVKPVEQGSTQGISIVKKSSDLSAALKLAWSYDREALLEQYIPGRELTVSVLGGKVLPVLEIIPDKADFYDYASKYEKGGSRHLCPAPISGVLARKAQELALKLHGLLGCKGATRSDMMLDRRNKLWILELNTLPGLTPFSLLPDAAKASGLSYSRLLRKMLAL